jgi:hypothetical protein
MLSKWIDSIEEWDRIDLKPNSTQVNGFFDFFIDSSSRASPAQKHSQHENFVSGSQTKTSVSRLGRRPE